MRFISLLVAFCFSMNVMASTGTIQELERAMDDYQYALTVEWDQKDQTIFQLQSQAFFDKMNKLISEGGLTQAKILQVIESKSRNKAAFERIKLKLNTLSKNVSSEELANIIKDSAKDMYAQGVSWNGEVFFSVAIGIVLIGALAYSIWWSSSQKCVAYEEKYVCSDVSNCYYTAADISGGYGYDEWGNWIYPGYTCYGPPRSTCGYHNVCTNYQKR